MKQSYIKPTTEIIEAEVATMLAMSTDRIPIDDTPKPPAANERRGEWGDLWVD